MKMRNFILASLLLLGVFACQKRTIQFDITSNQEGSVVYVNNERLGEAPLVASTYPGIITIEVRKEGFEDFSIIDTLQNDTIVEIHAQLFTKEELDRIIEQKRIEEQILKQKKLEEQLFTSHRTGEFTDFRDHQKYKWVKLGKQIWMAENLAYKIEMGSAKCWAYNNNPDNIKSYGYLYNWESAREACPDGWHLPSEQEWKQLSSFLGGDRQASAKMRERGYFHWIDGYAYRPLATNESGFTARPGGQRNDKGEFITIGTYANWWSSTAANSTEAFCFWLGYMGDYLNKDVRKKIYGFSVRCVRD